MIQIKTFCEKQINRGATVESKSFGVAAALIITFLVLVASNLAQSVLEPVVFAIFVIAIIWPMQKALQSKAPKSVALFVTILVTLGVIIALSSMLVWGGGEVAEWLTRNLSRVQGAFESSTKWLEEHDIFVVALATEHFNGGWLIGVLRTIAIRANILIGFALLVFIYVIMGLVETETFRRKLASLRDEETGRRLLEASGRTAKKLRKYMVVRTVASLVTGALTWGFIALMGLELAAAWGVLSFTLNYLPYIGPLIVTVCPALFAFIQSGSVEIAIIVFVGLSLIQLVVGSYLEPVLSGSALGMSPSMVVFAVLLWTFLWGVPGAFIGVPLAIAFLTFCECFPSSRWISDMLSGDQPAPAPTLKNDPSELLGRSAP
jgi:AI-2 transport protein TqsA